MNAQKNVLSRRPKTLAAKSRAEICSCRRVTIPWHIKRIADFKMEPTACMHCFTAKHRIILNLRFNYIERTRHRAGEIAP